MVLRSIPTQARSRILLNFGDLTLGAEFVTPTSIRSAQRREKGSKYAVRKHAQSERSGRQEGRRLEEDELAVAKVFA